jgi:tripeptidyl-peptidase-1
VKQPNPSVFHQTLNNIANPKHSSYGKHLTRAELKELVRPHQDSSDAVLDWLRSSGISDQDISADGEFINFFATIGQAEAMMDTKFESYQNLNKRSVHKVRTLKYSLPRDLLHHVDMVQPTTRFAQIVPERSQIIKTEVLGAAQTGLKAVDAANSTACNTTITPQCLVDLYKINGFTPSGKDSGFIGISGFLEQYAQFDDLSKWAAVYRPEFKNATFSWEAINGGLLTQNPNNAASDSVEANLDIQYTVGLTYPMENKFYSTSGRGVLVPDLDQPDPNENSNEPYLEYFTYLLSLGDDELPHTISTSYGEDEQSVPANYSQVVCNMIGQLGARGVSVLFSSGDTGVGSACQSNDGKNTTRFLPTFPASCPYVTAVGGTYQVEPEYAVSFSSGGFSDRWNRPWWQEEAVGGYLEQLGDKWQGLYNPKGRGIPDIAAQGRNFRVYDKGRDTKVSGTSASAPAMAGMIALLNAARKEAGQKPLGFLNPWLYQTGVKGLTDIVNGGSTGCTGKDIYSGLATPYVPGASWNATKGWDPVTGLGTPLFDQLLKLATEGDAGHHKRYDARDQRERAVRTSWS